MFKVDKDDIETIHIARKYRLTPGTVKCGIFMLFEQGFTPREVRFILRDLKIDSEDRAFSNTISRYYYTWKHDQNNDQNNLGNKRE